MKKICFVTTIGGTIRAFLVGFSKYLIENRNYDVTFVSAYDEILDSMQNEHLHFIAVPMKRGVSLSACKSIRCLERIFRENQFDIVQYATPNAAFYASLAAEKAGINNRLYTQWGIRYMGYEGGIRRAIFKLFEKTTCRKSTIVECESFSLLEFGIKEELYDSNKGSVIGKGSACGVDLLTKDIANREQWRKQIRSELNIPQEAIVYGYTGRLTKDKGVNELLYSFKDFQTNHPNAYLIMVGKYDNKDTLDQTIHQWAENADNVIFTGWTPYVERYYSAMDVFCSLSYREGFGLVVIEAAAMGLPAIVTNVPGQKDTIIEGETGFQVSAKDTVTVIEAMNYFYAHPSERVDMGHRARRFVEDNFEQKHLFNLLANHRDAIIENGPHLKSSMNNI